MCIHPNAGPTGSMEFENFSGTRHEVFRVFGIDATFNCMTSDFYIFLADREWLTRCNQYLLADNIYTSNHFCYRVFYLNAGIHLNKVEFIILIQKLKGACATVSDIQTGLCTYLADTFTLFFCDARSRCFFNHFLMAALHRTVPFAQMDGVAVFVCQHLKFYMTWRLQKLFHVDHVISKGSARFCFGK